MKALFYPDCPRTKYYAIESIFDWLGYMQSHDPTDDCDFAILWRDTTWPPSQPILEALASHKRVLNLNCRDISKRHVNAMFDKVFGYSPMIDPTTYQGQAISKHNENSLHGEGGCFVTCPVSQPDEQYVYQRFIDTIANERIIEYRVPIIVGVIPEVHILEKQLPTPDSLKTEAYRMTVVEVETIFSAQECDQILHFCREMGFDIGELDVLRDPSDDRIYILDANATPSGYEKVDMHHQAEVFAQAVRSFT